MPQVKTEAMDTYRPQARALLDAHDLEVLIDFKDGQKCPPWTPHVPSVKQCQKCGMVHGDHYRVTIRRVGTAVTPIRDRHPNPTPLQAISFDFWGSLRDREKDRCITDCDVVACVSADAGHPTDPVRVIAEMGVDLESHREQQCAVRIARFASRLRRFFTPEELSALAKITFRADSSPAFFRQSSRRD